MSPPKNAAHYDRLKLWGATIAENPPTVTYDSVMPDKAGADAEKGVMKWLEKVVSKTASTPEPSGD